MYLCLLGWVFSDKVANLDYCSGISSTTRQIYLEVDVVYLWTTNLPTSGIDSVSTYTSVGCGLF